MCVNDMASSLNLNICFPYVSMVEPFTGYRVTADCGAGQSFQKRCMIWAEFLNHTFFTKIIHSFMLYMPVKSEG